ncbi:Pentapeptide repeat-containing protein [Asanoa hainanensis]|uniref:Pentapeptide repeat-containing protein n=1 Tax=Asanoa hainanensis TaxID=560556 RepID=A0A239LLB4_9ACTN|nr:pentapeptide repeat-containing protein [Asanoa hainanensis]SNT30374.1 Pentapeptide repeat-containing protein [Asanoa hainanensis]
MARLPRWFAKPYEVLSLNTFKVRRRLRHEVPVWLRRFVISCAALAALTGVALLIWRGPFWFDSQLIESIKDPEKKAQAVTTSRTTLLQIALAFGGLATIVFTARSYLLTRSGQVADRYTKAATQLVSAHPAERIGAIYALSRLMRDSPRDHRAVVDLLAGFIREARPRDEYIEDGADLEQDGTYESGWHWVGDPLPIDVQTALTALNKRPRRYESPWIQLGPTDLPGAALLHGWVDNLHFEGSNLQGADLVNARCIKGVALHECDLRAANLSGARLPASHISGANLVGALLRWADLRGSSLDGSDLRGAALRGCNLKGASLVQTDLRGVDLTEVKGLTHEQLALAVIDDGTLVPAYLGKRRRGAVPSDPEGQ